jgi:hypothetical protein
MKDGDGNRTHVSQDSDPGALPLSYAHPVEMAGFEPAAPRSQSECANQAALHLGETGAHTRSRGDIRPFVVPSRVERDPTGPRSCVRRYTTERLTGKHPVTSRTSPTGSHPA